MQEGSETTWGRDRVEGGDAAQEAMHVLRARGSPPDSKSLL